MGKKEFVFRIILFAIFGCLLPFVFIAWRYQIFNVNQNPRVSLTGWGFVAIIIVFFFLRYIFTVLKRTIPFSLTYQVINGLLKVILPLVLLYFVVSALSNSIELFKQALLFTIFSESVAIVVNPFPRFMHDKGIDYVDGILDLAISKIKKAKEGK